MCIASILPDLGSYGWLLVELQRNGRFVQFLVCAPAILELPRRYHRLVTGTIGRGGGRELSRYSNGLLSVGLSCPCYLRSVFVQA